MRIYQLPLYVANQIAAGEVIESPASVVKELLENSLDSDATNIHIEIGYGGLNQIKVSDNGVGIVAEDLPLAVMAHATSKIKTLEDLYLINSMGFRGEALASIASVSKLSLSSRPASQEHAMMLNNFPETTILPCARTVGTTVEVLDLFFNAPVRKKFLKNEKLEFQAIEKVTKRFALSASHIHLTLKHNNKLILSLPAATTEKAKQSRIGKIFGSPFIKNAIYFEVQQNLMSLEGWISAPHYQKSQNDRQWVYINQRMVRDKLINHALKQAYEELLHPGRFPTCLLYLNLPGSEVDINVHPSKFEVRFQEPRLIHDFFLAQVTQALRSTSFEENKVFLQKNRALDGLTVAEDQKKYHSLGFESTKITAQESKNFKGAGSAATEGFFSKKSSWLALNEHVVLIFIEQQPYLVNLYVLQQKWLLNELIQSDLPLNSRPLLISTRYPINMSSQEKLKLFQEQLIQLGLDNIWDGNQLLIKSIPVKIPHLNLSLFLEKASLQELNLNQLLELLTKSQSFNLKLLSPEEGEVLIDFLISQLKQKRTWPGVFKELTAELCQEVLHE